jgi:Tfp pilus assembly protein PilF
MLKRLSVLLSRSVWLLCLSLALGGCGVSFFDSSAGNGEYYPESPTVQEENLVIPDVHKQQGASNAIEQLLNDANTALHQQDYGRAAALTERVIRIAPQDARGYFVLAQISYYQQQNEMSQSLLAKSRSLATHDRVLLENIERFEREHF